MKFMTMMLTVAMMTATTAQAAKLVSAETFQDKAGKTKTVLTGGFSETGFGGPSAVCFIGNAADVCKEIEKTAKASKTEYNEGGHGYFKVNSCEATKDKYNYAIVSLNYTAITDYDDENEGGKPREVSMVVTDCN